MAKPPLLPDLMNQNFWEWEPQIKFFVSGTSDVVEFKIHYQDAMI